MLLWHPPRIVNYETGKAGAKARSLWRLEPLRIRWVEFHVICYLSLSSCFSLPLLFLLLFYSFFSSSPFVLSSCDLMLHCGLSCLSLPLSLPPSLFHPGYFTASQGCSLSFFHFTSCFKRDICHICHVFFVFFLPWIVLNFLNRNKIHN